jgi:hypothetical protein
MKKLLLASVLAIASSPGYALAGAQTTADLLEQCNNPGPGEVDEDTARRKVDECLAIFARARAAAADGEFFDSCTEFEGAEREKC